MNKTNILKQKIMLCIIAVSIPGFLAIDSIQARKYAKLEHEVSNLERKQKNIVEQNKKLIADIGVLSSSIRIEKIASEKLNMRRAESDEIIRVRVKDGKK